MLPPRCQAYIMRMPEEAKVSDLQCEEKRQSHGQGQAISWGTAPINHGFGFFVARLA
jgi:hypothetical protein